MRPKHSTLDKVQKLERFGIINFFTLNWLIENEKLTIASNSGRWKTALLLFFYILFAVFIAANDLGLADT